MIKMKLIKRIVCLAVFFMVSIGSAQVGVGTVSPTETIDVDGTARVRSLDEGFVVSDKTGVIDISDNTKSTAGHMQWDNVLVGTKSALLLFTGRVSSYATDISFMMHYDVDQQSFTVMSEVNCDVTDIGATAGNNGRIRIEVRGVEYDLIFNNSGGFSNITASFFWIQGTFLAIANIK